MATKQGYGKLVKDAMVKEILADLKDKPNFFIANYMGSSVSDMENVRKSLKSSKSTLYVVKNSMLNVVLDQLKLEDMKKLVDGGVAVSLSGEDVIATCKALVGFSKTHEKFKIKGAYVDGKVLSTDSINHLASLPTKEVLLAQVVGGIKAPITGFVMVLGGVIRKFVYAVNAVKGKKEKEPQPKVEAAAAAPAAQAQPEAPKAPDAPAAPAA